MNFIIIKQKKLFCMIVVAVLIVTLFTGCGIKYDSNNVSNSNDSTTSIEKPENKDVIYKKENEGGVTKVIYSDRDANEVKISDLRITGKPYLNSELKCTYKYLNNNNQKLDLFYEWLRADSKTAENWEVIKSGNATNEDVISYVTAASDRNKFIKLRITSSDTDNPPNMDVFVESDIIGPIETVYIIDNYDLFNYYESENFGTTSYGGKSYNEVHKWNNLKGIYSKWYIKDIVIGRYKVYYYYPAYHSNNEQKPGIEVGHADGVYSDNLDLSSFTSDDNGTWVYI